MSRTKRHLFVGMAAMCLSEDRVQHVFSTSEEVFVALELVAKTGSVVVHCFVTLILRRFAVVMWLTYNKHLR